MKEKEWNVSVEDGTVILKHGKRRFAEFRVRLGIDVHMPPKAAAECGLRREFNYNVDDDWRRLNIIGGYGDKVNLPIPFLTVAKSAAREVCEEVETIGLETEKEIARLLKKEQVRLAKPAKQENIDFEAEMKAALNAFGVK